MDDGQFNIQENINNRLIFPETEIQKLNRFLIRVSESDDSIERKILLLKKYIDIINVKED
jgi:hypothetical protein